MIALFALRLIAGAALTWLGLPRGKITSGFFRVQMLVVLGLAVLAALTAGRGIVVDSSRPTLIPGPQAWIPCAALAVIAYAGSVLWMLERRVTGTACIVLIAIGSVGTLLGTSLIGSETAAIVGLQHGLSELTSAATVGGFVTAMLLGHWYLTATGMSLDPLVHSNRLLGCAVAARLAVAGWLLATSFDRIETQTQWLWLSLSWLAGLFGPLAAVLMVERILKYRNTQSATGVLFAGVILVFIGELSADLLARELSSWP